MIDYIDQEKKEDIFIKRKTKNCFVKKLKKKIQTKKGKINVVKDCLGIL